MTEMETYTEIEPTVIKWLEQPMTLIDVEAFTLYPRENNRVFILNGAELSMNLANSENLRNH